MQSNELTVGSRVEVQLGSWSGCEGEITVAGPSPAERDWCYWVQLDGMSEHLFKADALRPLDALAVGDGAKLL